jgi:hypothetical protein
MLGDDVSGYDILKKIRSTNEEIPVIFTIYWLLFGNELPSLSTLALIIPFVS